MRGLNIFSRIMIVIVVLLATSAISESVSREDLQNMSREEQEEYQCINNLQNSLKLIEQFKAHVEMADMAKDYSSSLSLLHHMSALKLTEESGFSRFGFQSTDADYLKYCPDLLDEYKDQLKVIENLKDKIKSDRPDLLHNALLDARENPAALLLYINAINNRNRKFDFEKFSDIVNLYKNSGDSEMVKSLAHHALLCAKNDIAPVANFIETPKALTLAYDYGFEKESYDIASREVERYLKADKNSMSRIDSLTGVGKFYAHANDLKNTLRVHEIARGAYSIDYADYMLYDSVDEFLANGNFDDAIVCASNIHKAIIETAALINILDRISTEFTGEDLTRYLNGIGEIGDSIVYQSSRQEVKLKIAEIMFKSGMPDESGILVKDALSMDNPADPPSLNLVDLATVVPYLVNSGNTDIARKMIDNYYNEVYGKPDFASIAYEINMILASLYFKIGDIETAQNIILINANNDSMYWFYDKSEFHTDKSIAIAKQTLLDGFADGSLYPVPQSFKQKLFEEYIKEDKIDSALELYKELLLMHEGRNNLELLIKCMLRTERQDLVAQLLESDLDAEQMHSSEKPITLILAKEYLSAGDVEKAKECLSAFGEMEAKRRANNRSDEPSLEYYCEQLDYIFPDNDLIAKLPPEKQKAIIKYLSDLALDKLFNTSLKSQKNDIHLLRDPEKALLPQNDRNLLDLVRYIGTYSDSLMDITSQLAPFYAKENRKSDIIPFLDSEFADILGRDYKIEPLVSLSCAYIQLGEIDKAQEVIDCLKVELIQKNYSDLLRTSFIRIYETFINCGYISEAESFMQDVNTSWKFLNDTHFSDRVAPLTAWWYAVNDRFSDSFDLLDKAGFCMDESTLSDVMDKYLEKGEFEWAMKLINRYPDVDLLYKIAKYSKEKNLECDIKILAPKCIKRVGVHYQSTIYDMAAVAAIFRLFGSREDSLEALKSALEYANSIKDDDVSRPPQQELFDYYANLGFFDELYKFQDYQDARQKYRNELPLSEIAGYSLNREYDTAIKKAKKITDPESHDKAFLIVGSVMICEGNFEDGLSLVHSKLGDSIIEENIHLVCSHWMGFKVKYDPMPESIEKLADAGRYTDAFYLLSCYMPQKETNNLMIYILDRIYETSYTPTEMDLYHLRKLTQTEDYFCKYPYSAERSETN